MLQITKPLIIFDVETTGLDVKEDRIVEIALIRFEPNGDKIEKVRLINPQKEIAKEAAEVHGITNEMVQNEPTFQQVAKSLHKLFEGCDIGGFNSNQFDVVILINEFKRCGIDFNPFEHNFVDVFTLETILNKRDLSSTYKKYFNEELDNAHSALVDIKATYEILLKQIEQYDLPNDLKGLNEFILEKRGTVDLSGKLKKVNDEICWNFGKNKNQPVYKDKTYAEWFLMSDFPVDSKKVVREVLLTLNKNTKK
jgi:DNA polymerase-3 subunit epsilon